MREIPLHCLPDCLPTCRPTGLAACLTACRPLEQVSLEASTCTNHLLDPDFGGVYASEEQALKTHLLRFKERLQRNPAARRAAGYAVVRETLRELGEFDAEVEQAFSAVKQADALSAAPEEPYGDWSEIAPGNQI